ncbi:hypothetical protein N7E70_025675 [Aminobacter sp. NyZ550]|uniref:hypothetical protein n=1 Tax=Aminobacter sp. NyZ550 TaxID=2979870 RepID=UPI0021D5C477|nr:hypothetical protein [Aminobacter sp. NyZ550]WAX94999.1 hypothetical protein N7E70_025675 [Aminobacter sp. NyZ550]
MRGLADLGGASKQMRFFTFEWATGEDSERDPVTDYAQFLSAADLAEPVRQLATSISLNEALLDCVVFNSAARELRLSLITGDLQVGYWRTEITYLGAVVKNQEVLSQAVANRSSEVWYDEFGVLAKQPSHSFLLVPENFRRATKGQEFNIEFTSFGFVQHAVSKRSLSTVHDVSVWC